MTGNLLLFPLQITASDFSSMDASISPTQLYISLGVILAIILIMVFINKKNNIGGKKTGGGGGGGGSRHGLIAMISLHKIARNIGLHNEQIRMLDYILRTDDVVEPEKSIANPALLDRHFRKTYRIIEHSSGTDEDAQRKLAILFSTRNMLENSTIGSVANTRLLKEDTVLIITFSKEKYEVSVLAARGENLVAESPKNVLGSQIKIPVGTPLRIVFFTKANKGFTFDTRVVGYGSFHGHHAVQLSHSAQLKFLSQRRFRRRSAVIACFLNLVYVEGSGKKQRLIVDKRRINGSIADISVGGCSIKAMAPIQVGAKFKIEFMQKDVNVAALGQVLRINKAGMSTTIHVRFLKVSQKSMNIINAYVYEYANE